MAENSGVIATHHSALDSHRGLAVSTARVHLILAAAVAVALAASGHRAALAGLGAGTLAGLLDTLLLVRGLDRFQRADAALSARALTGAVISRFAAVGTLVGLLMATRALNPLGVVAGFLLFPVALVVVGARAAGRERRRSGGGVANARR